jgi:hypothetical protein
VTQWLIEEAAFLALDVQEAQERSGAAEERREAARLMERHAELTALKERV